MPIIGQHAFRIEDPAKMEKSSYRTTAGGTLYGGKVKVPATVNIIWAKPMGKAKPADPPVVQSLKFPTTGGWTEEKAKKWLEDNKMSAKGEFKPAKKEKAEQAEDDDLRELASLLAPYNDDGTEEYSEKGNVSTFLQATIHRSFSSAADGLLGNGILSSEQRIAASSAIGSGLDEFRSVLKNKFPEAENIKYPRNKDDRMYFYQDSILSAFDNEVRAVSEEDDNMMMKPPLRANEALDMDDIELGDYVKKMLKRAMDRKRMVINVFEGK